MLLFLCLVIDIAIAVTSSFPHEAHLRSEAAHSDGSGGRGAGGSDSPGHGLLNDVSHITPPDELWYVTFVNEGYAHHAAVLAKALHDLNHVHPLLLMVRDDDPELVARIPEINKVFVELGWNARVETYAPLQFSFHTQYPEWDVAMQRISLFGLDPTRVKRFVHLDSDMLIAQNVDNLTSTVRTPAFARRMGGCTQLDNLYALAPITNFFVSEPDPSVFQELLGKVEKLSANNYNGSCNGCDEAGLISATVSAKLHYGGTMGNSFSEAASAKAVKVVEGGASAAAVAKAAGSSDAIGAQTAAAEDTLFAADQETLFADAKAEEMSTAHLGMRIFLDAVEAALTMEGKSITLLEPEDSMYWDCFRHSDRELTQAAMEHYQQTKEKKHHGDVPFIGGFTPEGAQPAAVTKQKKKPASGLVSTVLAVDQFSSAVPYRIKVLHLGMPGKAAMRKILTETRNAWRPAWPTKGYLNITRGKMKKSVASYIKSGNIWLADAIEKLTELHLDGGVHRIIDAVTGVTNYNVGTPAPAPAKKGSYRQSSWGGSEGTRR